MHCYLKKLQNTNRWAERYFAHVDISFMHFLDLVHKLSLSHLDLIYMYVTNTVKENDSKAILNISLRINNKK